MKGTPVSGSRFESAFVGESSLDSLNLFEVQLFYLKVLLFNSLSFDGETIRRFSSIRETALSSPAVLSAGELGRESDTPSGSFLTFTLFEQKDQEDWNGNRIARIIPQEPEGEGDEKNLRNDSYHTSNVAADFVCVCE